MLGEAFRITGVSASPDPHRIFLLNLVERDLGRRLPQAVRDWYSAAGAVEWLADHDDDDIVTLDQLGSPVTGLDFAASGFLVLATDSQWCGRWVVPLAEPMPFTEPLFQLPAPGWDPNDPPVYVVETDDVVCRERQRYADSFSHYVFTAVWGCLPAAEEHTHSDYDVPLRPGVVDLLRQEMTVLPSTYEWGYDTLHRFTAPDAQVMLATRGDVAAWLWIHAAEDARRERLIALLEGNTQATDLHAPKR